MRRRLAMLLSAALVATVIGVFAPASPASATGVCVGALGTATVTGGALSYPVVAGTFGVQVRQPVNATFNVNFPAATGTCVNSNTPGFLKGLTAAGTVSGWCGHSSGSGSTADGYRFAWVSAGSILVLTGGLTGIVNAIPDTLNGHSCNAAKPGGASAFIVSGVVLKLHCNVSKTKVTTPLPIPATLTTVVPGVLSVHTGSPTYNVKVCVGLTL